MFNQQPGDEEQVAHQQTDEINLIEYALVLWKRKWSMIAIIGVIVSVVIVMNFLVKPTFESQALLQIGIYQNGQIEPINDLQVILYSESSLTKLIDTVVN